MNNQEQIFSKKEKNEMFFRLTSLSLAVRILLRFSYACSRIWDFSSFASNDLRLLPTILNSLSNSAALLFTTTKQKTKLIRHLFPFKKNNKPFIFRSTFFGTFKIGFKHGNSSGHLLKKKHSNINHYYHYLTIKHPCTHKFK